MIPLNPSPFHLDVTAPGVFANAAGTVIFPPQSSSVAPAVDHLFYVITGISAVFFVLIVVVMTYFVMKYRRRPGLEPTPSPSHNTSLEVAWSVIPGPSRYAG